MRRVRAVSTVLGGHVYSARLLLEWLHMRYSLLCHLLEGGQACRVVVVLQAVQASPLVRLAIPNDSIRPPLDLITRCKSAGCTAPGKTRVLQRDADLCLSGKPDLPSVSPMVDAAEDGVEAGRRESLLPSVYRQ
ncbi:hypothetical protein E2C01_093128 [Portunus trituberculatus]|uniref:Uncharacterized protein n=1 Tax=Portunus trituberculatus TaxID=210409 RepID=A0A5B7JU19_PORTR|nr:hypothetical protein [Portunus trituberculatus]